MVRYLFYTIGDPTYQSPLVYALIASLNPVTGLGVSLYLVFRCPLTFV